VIRDPARKPLYLPCRSRAAGLTRAEMLRDPVSRRGLEGIFKTGQLPDVREAFLRRWASTERNSRRPTISLTSRPRRVIAHTV